LSNITVKLSNVDIEIPSDPIGLSLSGGADSSLLAFILLKYSRSPIHFFTTVDTGSNQRNLHYAPLVIKKCIELTNNYNVHHHIKFVEQYDRDQFFKHLEYCVDLNQVSVMFTGTTALPPDSVLDTFTIKLNPELYARRDPNNKKSVWSKNRKFYSPLINLNKTQIRDLYRELGIFDNIVPLTNSCTDKSNRIDHCGQCWWCQERKWAFE
jgi:hypothetical protein